LIYDVNEINNTFTNINITGPVKYPGSYDLEFGKTIGDLIVSSGGFKNKVNKVKITIARRNNNSFYPYVFNFPKDKNSYLDISSISNPNSVINNFLLKSYDIINIYSNPKNRDNGTVLIDGAVFHPGIYPILSDNEKVSDIILRAGGLLNEAYPMASTFNRSGKRVKLSFENIIKNKNTNDDFDVLPGDEIRILTKSNIVEVVGEVKAPGNYKYVLNKNLNYYINIAGGYTTKAERKEVWVTYPNGESKQLKNFFSSPKIYDSSLISVGRQEETEPIDKTELAKEISSIVSDFLQIALTIAILSNNISN